MKARKKSTTIILLLFFAFAITGCLKNPFGNNNNENKLDPDNFFDFLLKSDVELNVNYAYPGGGMALIEVYGENPMTLNEDGESVKRDDVQAYFKAYTDDNSKYSGKINIPSSLKEVYLYTREMGMPRCVTLDVKDGKIEFDLTQIGQSGALVATKGIPNATGGEAPYVINESKGLYSLTKWNSEGTTPNGYMTTIYNVGEVKERFMFFTQRVQKTLWAGNVEKPTGLDNTKYLSGIGKTNISISNKTANGTAVAGASVDIVLVHEGAHLRNTLCYYYYKTGTTPDVTTLKKYVVIPNVSIQGNAPYSAYNGPRAPIISVGQKIRLKYFGVDGKGDAVDKFPAGYTIGWALMSNGFNVSGNKVDVTAKTFYSNDGACITLYDAATKKLVVGFEDGSDKSYEDVLFYVEADPLGAVVDPANPGVPSVDPDDDINIPDAIETISGTLAFEDIWPWGGDYDLNDAVIEYKREILFNKDNVVKKITETYRPVHNGAKQINAFATMYDSDLGGTLTLPAGAVKEDATGAIILFSFIGDASGVNSVLVRDFGNGTIKKDALPAWNPFLIVKYTAPSQPNRTEVHLPKHKPTILVDKSLVLGGDEAHYIYKNGKYPFALDLPVSGWKIPVEMTKISDAYSKYTDWAENKTNTDWYNYPVAGKVQ